VPVPPIGVASPPPVDIASVIGKKIIWHLSTTQGAIDIELLPDIAPWNVATIVSLTQKGFYDGLAFHRVVYDFVVQGGDPTQSGWGGPGFTTPAEPSTLVDGAAFVEGGVGIADAGRDSGGSQFFIMHAAAPHLDGRYTQIGRVIDGQKSADAMRIGDRVLRATIEIR
jgi:cyclophilin family peptidyl-prolyl cis-trans isomerase